MKNFKKQLSFLLAAALIISSLTLGFGQIKSQALQAAGQTIQYRIYTETSAETCNGSGTDNDYELKIIFDDGETWYSDVIVDTGASDQMQPGDYNNFYIWGPAKPITSTGLYQMNYTSGGDWYYDTIQIYADFGTRSWVQISTRGSGNFGTAGGTIDVPYNGAMDTTYNKTLTFNGNGGTVNGSSAYTVNAIQGASLPASNIPSVAMEGYNFAGWSPAVPSAGPSADTTYTAQWTTSDIFIAFDANGGTGSTGVYMNAGETLSAPAVTRTGYTFTGWSPEVPPVVPDISTTYTAQWSANTYTVTFWPYDGTVSPATSTVTYGSTYGEGTGGFPTPEKTGFTFGGWYANPDEESTRVLSTTIVTLSCNQYLYAKWIENTYTVVYDGNGSTGGSTATSTHTCDTPKTLTANGFTKEGFAFAGWATSPDGDIVYSDRQSVINLAESNTSITLYAKWTDVNIVTITFDANGGTGGTITTLIIGSALTAPTVTRTGYTFASWAPAVPSTVPAENTTYLAQWTAKTFTVTFNPQSGTVTPTSSTVTYGSTYGAGTGGFPTPVRSGYTFGGWFTSTNGAGTQVLSTTIAARTSSQTLYAFWIVSPDSVTITFDANGGTGGTITLMTIGATLTAPTVTKTGYTFAGWLPAVPPAVPAANTTFTAQWTVIPSDSDYTYTVSGSQATITKYNGTGGNVAIPNTLGGFPVIKIGSQAFINCTAITSISLPGSLTAIGPNAFNNCTGITTITIPDSVGILDDYAFNECTNLTVVTFGSGLKVIGAHAFQRCFLLNNVVIPGSVTDIESLAFYSCTALTKISIPDSVTTLGTAVFGNCTALTDVTLSNNLTYISGNLFNGCTNLAGITIPSGVTSIGDFAFADCVKLVLANIPNGITRVEDYVFYNCSSLKQINIPESVTTIGTYAFGYCSGLTNITIPSKVTDIGDNTFNYCTGLTGAYFLGTAPILTADVFSNCASGFTVYYLPDKTGFTSPTWYGYPTAVFTPVSTIVFDANGGTGGTGPTAMTPGTALTAPAVTKTGYTFTGWTPAVPATVPAIDTTYIAQWTIDLTEDVQFIVSNSEGISGDIITVSITISENSTIGAAKFELPFDPELLEYVSASAGTALSTGIADINFDAVNSKIIMTYINSDGLIAGGTIIDVQFRIKDGALPQTINTNFAVVELTDSNFVPLQSVITQGTISVTCMLGDVNGDRAVTAVDALMALKAASGKFILSVNQKLAADVNKDGKVNSLDALMILKYTSGKITSF